MNERRKRNSPPPRGEGQGVGGTPAQTAYVRANASAKRFRRDLTATEKRLWEQLKSSAGRTKVGHFRKQAPLGPYVVDFVNHGARLIVELDGPHHEFADRAERDAARDAWLVSQGYRVLRFKNDEAWNDLPGVIARIVTALPPTPTPLPTRGRGKAPYDAGAPFSNSETKE